MSECRFTNSNGRSLDPWCATHERSAICCMRELREAAEGLLEKMPARYEGDERSNAAAKLRAVLYK